MLGSEPVVFGLPFAPPEMVETLIEQRETGVVQPPITAPFAPTVAGREAAEQYAAMPPPAAPPTEIPPLIKFIAPGATPAEAEDIIKAIQDIQEISPLAAFIEPGAGMERQIEITEALVPYAGTAPGILPPGVELPAFPDILGGLGDIGKYALMAGALILGVFAFDRLTRKK